MSKSAHDPSSRILLTDTPDEVQRKIKKAITDSVEGGVTWDPIGRPGVANLITVLCACRDANDSGTIRGLGGNGHDYSGHDLGSRDMENLLVRYTGHRGLKELKADVAEAVIETLRGPREEFERLKGETGYLQGLVREGGEKARAMGKKTMKEVREMIGLA